jgi:Flp pilus assembly pilin Flp
MSSDSIINRDDAEAAEHRPCCLHGIGNRCQPQLKERIVPLFIMNLLEQFRVAGRDESGEVTIEWGILVVFIALALILVVGVIVGGINTWFTSIASFIAGTTPT